MCYFTTHVHNDDDDDDDWDRLLFRDNFWKKKNEEKKFKWIEITTTKIRKKQQEEIHSFKWNLFPHFLNKQRTVNNIRGIHFFSYILWYWKRKSKEIAIILRTLHEKEEIKKEIRWILWEKWKKNCVFDFIFF